MRCGAEGAGRKVPATGRRGAGPAVDYDRRGGGCAVAPQASHPSFSIVIKFHIVRNAFLKQAPLNRAACLLYYTVGNG